MSDDGVALTSISHPRDERLIERVARAICVAKDVYPDGRYIDFNGVIRAFWELRRNEAIAAIEAYDGWLYELAEKDISDALERIEIRLAEEKQ